MVEAAKRGANEAGYELERLPGRGLSNTWIAAKGRKKLRASIRTTQNRWIAFPPLEGGRRWKTLDDVDLVIVAAVNDKDKPRSIQVYIFDASELKDRFKQAYQARTKVGQSIQDDFGMWINLDRDDRNLPASAGAGIAEKHGPVGEYEISSIEKVEVARSSPTPSQEKNAEALEPQTIADVMSDARAQIARLAGVELEAVKLELKIEY